MKEELYAMDHPNISVIEECHRTCCPELTGWCRRMTGDPVLAEDLVQEAFLRSLLHLPLLESLTEKQSRAWFYRTVKNLFLDRKRHERYKTVAETLPQAVRDAEEYDMTD